MNLQDWGNLFVNSYAPAGVRLGDNNNVYDQSGNFWGTWGSGTGFVQGGEPNKAKESADTSSSASATTSEATGNSSLSGLLSDLLSLYTGKQSGGNVSTGTSLTSGLSSGLLTGADDSSNLMVSTGTSGLKGSNIIQGGLNAGLTFEPLSSYYTGSTPATTSTVPTTTTPDATTTNSNAVQNAINLQSGAAWNQGGLNFPNYSALGKNKFQDLFD